MELHSPVESLPGVGSIIKKKLEKLNIFTVEDLIYHIPYRYEDYTKFSSAKSAQVGDAVSIRGSVKSSANVRSKSGKKMFVAEIEDESGKIRAVWFSQPYLIAQIKKGANLLLMGKVSWFGKEKVLVSPLFFELKVGLDIGKINLFFPIYPETKGLTSKWFRSKMKYIFENHSDLLKEFLPVSLKNGMIDVKTAFNELHNPDNLTNFDNAKKRFAFNELLKLFLTNQKRKEIWKNYHASKIINSLMKVTDYEKLLSFKLTDSQRKAIEEIAIDLKKPTPMNRLLEGDVGSGKTAVAAAACYFSFANGHQSVIMAPTQILAVQHYKTLTEIFKKLNVRISLLTSGISKQTLGKTDIFVGTHALLHRKLDLNDVAVVVIDEQHRFGVEQRTHLITASGRGKKIPHILTMTATPIPRTIAMSLYGDLDLSVLSEMPHGRVPITTWLVPENKRSSAYDWIKDKLIAENIQVYIICPLIEESENDSLKEIKSAKKEYENIKKIFVGFTVDLLHGKLKPKEKEDVINNFKEGKTQILVSTAVVEVGIDVANATVIVIEGTQRFGLAQLHQLRGRVGRGTKKSYCMLFTESTSEKINKRLNILKTNTSGFELAEMDLRLRGSGDIFGSRQSGFARLKVANWSDFELIKSAKSVSEQIKANSKIKKQVYNYFFGTKPRLN